MGTESVTSIPEIPPDVSLHIMGEGALLLDRRRQMLFSENRAGTFLWCCLAEGMSGVAIVAELRDRFGLTGGRAEAYLRDAIAQWRAAGLLDAATLQAAPVASNPHEDMPADLTEKISREGAVSVAYRLLDTSFILTFGDAGLHRAAAPLLAHLKAFGAAPENATRLTLARAGDDIVLYRNGLEEGRCRDLDCVAPLTLGSVVFFAIHRCRALCAVHAGAVAAGGGLILLPADSGAGKSTLVAALAAEGYAALADDTVVLDEDTLDARPVPSGISLKEGAWPVLAERHPGLADLPVYTRGDGKRVRYLPQAHLSSPPPAARHRVTGILFPQYRPDGPASLAPLGAAEALKRLVGRFYLLDRSLDATAMEQLIAWIGAIPCRELHYSTTGDGIAAFREFCR